MTVTGMTAVLFGVMACFLVAPTPAVAMQCQSYGGAAVDAVWVHFLGAGRGWYYWDSAMAGAAPIYKSNDPTADVANPLRTTLNQLGGWGGGAPAAAEYAVWDTAAPAAGTHGQGSGLLAWSTANNDAFYVIHSIPGYPVDHAVNANPLNALGGVNMHGAALCVSLTRAAVVGGVPFRYRAGALPPFDNAANALPVGLDWNPANQFDAILQHLAVRRVVIRLASAGAGVAVGPYVPAANPALHDLLWKGVYHSVLTSHPNGIAFDMYSKTHDSDLDLWTESIAVIEGAANSGAGGVAFAVKDSTWKDAAGVGGGGGGGSVRNPSQCCGRGAVAPGNANRHCRAGCVNSFVARALSRSAGGVVAAQAYFQTADVSCYPDADVVAITQLSRVSTVWNAASDAAAAGAAVAYAADGDNAKWAYSTTNIACIADFDRTGSAGAYAGGHNGASGSAVCSTGLASVHTLLTQLTHQRSVCPGIPIAAPHIALPVGAMY